jgi:hypothetical protein
MAGSDEDRGRSRRPRAEYRGWSGTGQVIPCVVCTIHKETRSASFLVEPQKQGR